MPATQYASRALRVARVLKLLFLVEKGVKTFLRFFKKDSLNYILIYSITLVAISGIVFSSIEHIDMTDGVWWSLVTVTTVGLGTFIHKAMLED